MSTGGVRTGGASNTGGAATGGAATGGQATGGTATGGKATGGAGTGGKATGGTATGGKATGGNATGGNTCGTAMRNITSMALVKDMGIGWNLGNTMDAPTETGWGNPLTTQAMIQAIAASGFKSIRIPVTWSGHFGAGPGYVIDAAWMSRVQQIVDWVVGAGMYAIINMHHDGVSGSGWILGAATNPTGVIAEYKALWAQIAQRFRCYSDYLVLESMNEVGFDPPLSAAAGYALLNQINGEFVTLVRASGGNNGQRHLLLAGYWTDFYRSAAGVVMPNDSRSILSLHYYSPYQFAINGNPTTWGSAAEVATLKADFAVVKTSFIDRGIPVILGEYGAAAPQTEVASRLYYFEYIVMTSTVYGIAPYLWDAWQEFNRSTLTWRTPGILDTLRRASSGQSYTPVKG